MRLVRLYNNLRLLTQWCCVPFLVLSLFFIRLTRTLLYLPNHSKITGLVITYSKLSIFRLKLDA